MCIVIIHRIDSTIIILNPRFYDARLNYHQPIQEKIFRFYRSIGIT